MKKEVEMQTGRPVPILRILDPAKAMDFYAGYLGFRVDWQHHPAEHLPVYVQVSRGVCVLHLSGHQEDGAPGGRILVPVVDIDGLHRELAARSAPGLAPTVRTTPWGSRDLHVVDPFGNRLTFSEAGSR